MDILFVTFGELSIGGGAVRSVSILRALADAGHHVDVVASHVDLPDHPNIRILMGSQKNTISKYRLRMEVLWATGRHPYEALHAVGDAVVFLSGMARLRKIRLVYQAVRCFSGPVGNGPSCLWRFFPGHFQRLEKRILLQSTAVLTPCRTLTSDLLAMVPDAEVAQIEDVPAQSLFCGREIDRGALLSRFEEPSSAVVVCSILPGSRTGLRNLLMATRKVIDSIPAAVFFFKGSLVPEAKSMAASLDILGRCSFFAENETETFLSSLEIADAALLVPPSDGRYVHHEVFSLLRSSAPLVAVQNPAYGNLLTEQNSIQVLLSSESIAEGLLRAIQEPLFSLGIATEGQQLIAKTHSFSSFKHKVRMVYHEVLKQE